MFTLTNSWQNVLFLAGNVDCDLLNLGRLNNDQAQNQFDSDFEFDYS